MRVPRRFCARPGWHWTSLHTMLPKGPPVLDAVRYSALHNGQARPVRAVAGVADALRANRQKSGLFSNYLEFVDKTEADMWFAIVPLDGSANAASI